MRTPRVKAAQEKLHEAILEMMAASDEMDIADATRLGKFEELELLQTLASKGMVSHWAVAVSRLYFERDKDDPEDTEEYQNTYVSVLVRDNTAPGWIIEGLLKYAAKVID